jgi:anti-anti-sigma factor
MAQVNWEGEKAIIEMPEIYGVASLKGPRDTITELLEKHTSTIVIDFKRTHLIDSSGIGTLVSLSRAAKSAHSTLTLRNLNDDIRSFFIETDLDKLFTIDAEGELKEAQVDLFEEAVDIKLEISRDRIGDIGVLMLKGIMHYPSAPKFFQQQFFLAMIDHKKILLDFSELTFIDSLCVSVLTTMNKILTHTGGSLRICAPNFIIEDLFTTLSLRQIIPWFSTRDQALESWA